LLGLDIGFHPGAFWLAERFRVPLLPVVLTGSHRVWEYPFSPRLRYHQKIRMEVLEPIDGAHAVARMREIERDMKRRALAVDDAPARRYVPDRDGKWEGYSFLVDPDLP
jgi:1-acyl-sn-glycerol-3-phosphate acyltransferase